MHTQCRQNQTTKEKAVKFGLYSLSGSDIQKGQVSAHTMQTKSNDTRA